MRCWKLAVIYLSVVRILNKSDKGEKTMSTIDDRILNIDRVICRHIGSADFSPRGAVSQDVLAQLRNFLEHIMLKFYANGGDIDNTYENICKAIEFVQTRGDLKLLYKFHNYLQIVASHYTLDEENSERLMLKYYKYLLETRILLREKCGLEVLSNLEKFPLNVDKNLQEYYERISNKVDMYDTRLAGSGEKYYIQKIKPFFVGGKIYYEVTFTPANDYSSKSNRVIAFTRINVTDNYAAKFHLVNDSIEMLGKTMPIIIIVGWEVAIRDCEYQNFISVVTGTRTKPSYPEQRVISRFLSCTGSSLCDLMDFPDNEYRKLVRSWKEELRSTSFIDVLASCRKIIKSKSAGQNVLRYLLYSMNNVVIKCQKQMTKNENLSNLYLQNGCIPFDTMPFINSPIGHNPRMGALFDCIPIKDRKHELLARLVRNNTEIRGQLFTTVRDIVGFDDIPTLAEQYNDALWFGHREYSKLVIESGQIFINGYKQDTCNIIRKLKSLSVNGIQNYTGTVEAWLNGAGSGVDSEEKREALKQMFSKSQVAIVYGSAGVGKSTLINHVAHFFSEKNKLFLSQTNPAVDNLKRRVTAASCTFSTITRFLTKRDIRTNYDLLVIDECSTVSNSDMKKVLEKATFQLLLLVGDTYQINSIRFGNWFSVVRKFIPESAVFELNSPYRSSNEGLLTLWSRVRNMDDTIMELIARQEYSISLDTSIFNPAEEDEIILCLNYDGLYGINNINRFLQESNPNPSVTWGIQQYKIGDPILFNDSDRFSPVIYNNMKGKVVGIQVFNEDDISGYIQFDIELNKIINGLDAMGCDFELLENSENGNSIIRFIVNKTKSVDDDDSSNSRAVVPFQVAYAVSIHKAQGLEYSSVKIVITDEIDELITHNIFYTAITRAQNKLKIYWTPEVEHKVLTSIKPRDIKKDVGILRKYLLQ